MPSVCFYFQVHQPFRLRRYSVFDTDQDYFDSLKNIEICKKVARKCYLPANEMLLENIQKHEGRFRVAFSISGVALEQFEHAGKKVSFAAGQLARKKMDVAVEKGGDIFGCRRDFMLLQNADQFFI